MLASDLQSLLFTVHGSWPYRERGVYGYAWGTLGMDVGHLGAPHLRHPEFFVSGLPNGVCELVSRLSVTCFQFSLWEKSHLQRCLLAPSYPAWGKSVGGKVILFLFNASILGFFCYNGVQLLSWTPGLLDCHEWTLVCGCLPKLVHCGGTKVENIYSAILLMAPQLCFYELLKNSWNLK